MTKNETNKDESTKTKNEKRSNIKGKKQKKRAKGLNKNAPPRRAQKANFLARIFCACKYDIKVKKSNQVAQKSAKRRSQLLRAYYRKQAHRYKCDTSVLCLYCGGIIVAIGAPIYTRQPLR